MIQELEVNHLKFLKKLKEDNQELIKIITNNTNLGQSFSLIKGIKESSYNTIVTLDGDGMIMKADVLARSLDKNLPQDEKIIYLSPKGKIFDHNCAKRFSEFESINFICGHFEGIDQRIIDSRNIEEISIGDFVLSGGETAVFVVLDAILRFEFWREALSTNL